MDKMRELVYRLREEANMVRGLTAFTGVYKALNDASDALLAAQSVSVPVAGDVVAWVSPLDIERIQANDGLNVRLTAGKEAILISDVPLYLKPATSISAAELDALRKDAERLQYMLDEAAIIMCAVGTTSTMYRLEWPLTGYVQTDFHKSEREAIDAAIAGEK